MENSLPSIRPIEGVEDIRKALADKVGEHYALPGKWMTDNSAGPSQTKQELENRAEIFIARLVDLFQRQPQVVQKRFDQYLRQLAYRELEQIYDASQFAGEALPPQLRAKIRRVRLENQIKSRLGILRQESQRDLAR